MVFETPNFVPAIPEMFVLAMACVALVLDVFVSERYRLFTYQISQATLVAAAVMVLLLHPQHSTVTFNGTYVSDAMASVLKVFIFIVAYFVFFYSKDYLRERNLFKGSYLTGLSGAL